MQAIIEPFTVTPQICATLTYSCVSVEYKGANDADFGATSDVSCSNFENSPSLSDANPTKKLIVD